MDAQLQLNYSSPIKVLVNIMSPFQFGAKTPEIYIYIYTRRLASGGWRSERVIWIGQTIRSHLSLY